MKPAPFDYVRATSIDHGCALLAEAGGGAQLLAGGQTLMPLLALRMSQPFILIDIGQPYLNTEDFLATLDANLKSKMASW